MAQLKDLIVTGATRLIGDVYYTTAKQSPIMSRTYTGLYHGKDSTADSRFLPICVKTKDSSKVIGDYHIKFAVTTTSPGYSTYQSVSICDFWFNRTGSVNCYAIWNSRVGSYLHYYITVAYPTTNAYFDSIGTHLGIYLYSGNNCNSSSYTRTSKFDILEVSDDLEVTLEETSDLKNYTLMDWYTGKDSDATISIANYNGVDVGLQESGDANTNYYERLQNYSIRYKTGSTYRVNGYSIVGLNQSGNLIPISVAGTSETTTAYTIANGTRIFNTTEGFDYSKELMYQSTSTDYAVSGATGTSQTYPIYPGVDLRYSDNIVASNSSSNTLGLTEYKPIYIRGVIKEDGLFYIRPLTVTYSSNTYYRATTQDIPTTIEYDEDGYQYTYWFLGYPYYNSSYTTRGYQISLYLNNTMYWFHNGSFQAYDPSESEEEELTMTATLSDGTTKTYILYGKES